MTNALKALRQQARRFAARMHSDAAHCEHVRRLAAQLFDQLAPVHGLPPNQRVPLELGALLHEVGLAVNRAIITNMANIWCATRTSRDWAGISRRWSRAWCVITAEAIT